MASSVTSFQIYSQRGSLTSQNFVDLASFRKSIASISGATIFRIQAYQVDSSGNEYDGEYTYGIIPIASNSIGLGYLNTLIAALSPVIVICWISSSTLEP